jgi:hypothetical protein
MSPHAIIFGLCFFGMLATFLVAMFRTVADTDKRKIPPPVWFKCLACGVYECTDGRQQWRPPLEPTKRFMRFPVRECAECKAINAHLLKASKSPLIF